jgi:hypothetical protein
MYLQFTSIPKDRQEGTMMQKRRSNVWVLLLVLGLTLFNVTQVFAEPKNWPAPWDSNIVLTIGTRNPNYTGKHGTWQGNWSGTKYAIDFLPNGNSSVQIYSPIGGTVEYCGQYDVYGNMIRIATDDINNAGKRIDILLAHFETLNPNYIRKFLSNR